ncbi:hypothetical protein [Streptomyces anulatus]|uniref:hypothetical protein n=1 Tax=Streptomyces anulatus TaxID=1892 RepID=UPI0036A93F41
MTRTARTLLLLYLSAFGCLTCLAATEMARGSTTRGITVYAAALAVLAATGREVHHQGLAQMTAIRDRRPRPHAFPSDLGALVRADLAGNCGCARWWATVGADHDRTCPHRARTAPRHEEGG